MMNLTGQQIFDTIATSCILCVDEQIGLLKTSVRFVNFTEWVNAKQKLTHGDSMALLDLDSLQVYILS